MGSTFSATVLALAARATAGAAAAGSFRELAELIESSRRVVVITSSPPLTAAP